MPQPTEKMQLTLQNDNFLDFVEKLADLTSISDSIKIKFDKKNILAYSVLSNDVSVLALKNYLLNTADYITQFESEKTFDLIIVNAAKFVKNLRFFNTNQAIKFDIESRQGGDDNPDIQHIRACRFSNGKLKISCIGGELSKIRDITKVALEQRINPKNSKWSFKCSNSDFSDVKKLSSINSEDRVLQVQVNSGKVHMMEESKWDLEVDKIDDTKNRKIIFNKKYLQNINDDSPEIEFKIFETFILVSDKNSNLILSFETDFEGPDD